ncbi:MAG: NAD(P)/FAD-dependent oxidoreductase [Pseudomonadota bacterium]
MALDAAGGGPRLRSPKIVIIGAGMTGIASHIRLREAGIPVENITILEKADRVGGTWRDNTYPGVACDVPSHHYAFSFEPYAWSHQCAEGAEIQGYMEMVSAKYGVTDNVRFGEAVTACRYDGAGRWLVETDQGGRFEADFVLSATGVLHHPNVPKIDGLECFAGAMWHSAEWRNDVDLEGKRIGVIGNGSTAHQFIPHLINAGHETTVFMRTPQWVFPNPRLAYSETMKRRWREKPERMRFWKGVGKWFMEQFFVKATIGRPFQNWVLNRIVRNHLRLAVKDRALRAKLTPDYGVGCKRMILDSTFYPAIQKPNAHLETTAIERIEPGGVRLTDGRLIALDVLILATGFQNFSFMRPMDLVGADGLSIDEAWAEGRYDCYNSVHLPGFPNFFLMLGPTTPVGNNSVIAMTETQLGYIEQIIDLWRRGEADAVDVRPEAMDAYRAFVKKGFDGTVWVSGCQSWYLDGDGMPAIWPYDWPDFVKLMAAPKREELALTTHRPAETAQAATSDA